MRRRPACAPASFLLAGIPLLPPLGWRVSRLHSSPMDQLDIIRQHSQELDAQPTGLEPRLQPLPDIRVVVWDVYGTLVISASGDISIADEISEGSAMIAALQAVDITLTGNADAAARVLIEAIHQHQQEARELGHPVPEVDIRLCWRSCCQNLHERGQIDRLPTDEQLPIVALQYELLTNPVWPMPGSQQVLARLRDADVGMGIVSNAQFYTSLLFPALFLAGLTELGFDPELRWYSYAHRRAKPDRWLYDQAVAALAERNIEPRQCLYVGNDKLNDILPASQAGMRTALFAGDRRSLRLREQHAEAHANEPDLILTSLEQLPDCVL